jgi:hypothetical protein
MEKVEAESGHQGLVVGVAATDVEARTDDVVAARE